MELITSKSNEKIKYAVKLRESASFRNSEGAFFIEGARLCFDAVKSGVSVITLFITDEALLKYSDYTDAAEAAAQHVYAVTKDVSLKLSDTKNPQGVFCICKMLDKNANIGKIKYYGKYVALEDISNPGNFGTVTRTAEAVGLDGVIVSGGCDIYNPKALRASMGALFRIQAVFADNLPEFISTLRANGMDVYASVPDSSAKKITDITMKDGTVFVIGNEGNGISDETKKASSKLVTIPMRGRAESLNAAAAASIIMWEMMR